MKMKLKQLALAILSLALISGSVLTACAPKTASTTITDVSAGEASALIAENRNNEEFIILDVRTPEEFAAGHIDGATNINFALKDFRERLMDLKRDNVYLVYCRSGNRSGQAIEVMKELHFDRIYHLSDGMSGWTAAGMGVVR